MFIFEPAIFVVLAGALVMPALLGLIGSEVGARKQVFRGQGWAIAALLAVAGIWNWRVLEQQKAVRMAGLVDLSAMQPVGSPAVAVQRVFASPYPVNPYKWHLVVETADFAQLSTAETRAGTLSVAERADVFYRPETTLATLAAKRSRLGEAYLDWAMFPVVMETEKGSAENGWESEVTFRDLRFLYDVAFLKGRTNAPLTGKVTLDGERRVVAMEMNGRVEK